MWQNSVDHLLVNDREKVKLTTYYCPFASTTQMPQPGVQQLKILKKITKSDQTLLSFFQK